MSPFSVNMDDFALDSGALAGSLAGRLAAARAAGFNQITLHASDLSHHPEGWEAAVAGVLGSGLRVSAFDALNDFEGLSGPLQACKLDVAKALLEMCQAVHCHQLVLNASTLAGAASDNATLVRHLRQLAMLAIPKNIRIAYRAHAGAHSIRDFGQAWDLVCMADMPNLGLCLDATQTLASRSTDNDLEMLDAGKLFLVQLADSLDLADPQARLFPGEGVRRTELATFVSTLHTLGYRGDYSLGLSNPDYQSLPAPGVADRAWRAALWLGQDVLQRSVPLPNQIRLRRVLTH